eukprot:CAMPEP_0183352630 /NCGR_PEP_ID=MMETSP0164_2-20130417/29562_1 /TAXON_ID=221442 /ORGANISM="Coccolithus pelagicus ssp braarudi, Strain PLY182g" /LENGTH=131 /DNA_ID=CAMNT_0025525111 /DNA_START=64 /DNA_END=459 /DNA_ORIENTATION=-
MPKRGHGGPNLNPRSRHFMRKFSAGASIGKEAPAALEAMLRTFSREVLSRAAAQSVRRSNRVGLEQLQSALTLLRGDPERQLPNAHPRRVHNAFLEDLNAQDASLALHHGIACRDGEDPVHGQSDPASSLN